MQKSRLCCSGVLIANSARPACGSCSLLPPSHQNTTTHHIRCALLLCRCFFFELLLLVGSTATACLIPIF
jgi:hypothetical protein